MRIDLRRRAMLGATLLAALPARKPAWAEAVELHSPDSIVPVVPPVALPDLELRTLAGVATSAKAYFGQPLVLNFWATWCIPCVAELPELDRLAAGGGVTVLAVSADHGGAGAVTPFLARHALSHAVVLLDAGGDAARAVQVVGFPTTLVIDAKGRLRGRLEGPVAWGGAMAAVRRLVG